MVVLFLILAFILVFTFVSKVMDLWGYFGVRFRGWVQGVEIGVGSILASLRFREVTIFGVMRVRHEAGRFFLRPFFDRF